MGKGKTEGRNRGRVASQATGSLIPSAEYLCVLCSALAAGKVQGNALELQEPAASSCFLGTARH